MKVRCEFDPNQMPSKETLSRLAKAEKFSPVPYKECTELTDQKTPNTPPIRKIIDNIYAK